MHQQYTNSTPFADAAAPDEASRHMLLPQVPWAMAITKSNFLFCVGKALSFSSLCC
jgi:hypothetical protein